MIQMEMQVFLKKKKQMQLSWIPKMQMRHFQMQMHLNPSLNYTPATVGVCREETDHLAEDELLLKVEDL